MAYLPIQHLRATLIGELSFTRQTTDPLYQIYESLVEPVLFSGFYWFSNKCETELDSSMHCLVFSVNQQMENSRTKLIQIS